MASTNGPDDQALLEDLGQICLKRVAELSSLWREMGVEDLGPNGIKRTETVKTLIESTFKKMVREEQGHLKDVVNYIEELENQRIALISELNRGDPNGGAAEGALTDQDYEGLSMIQISNKLKVIIDDLNVTKEERMVEIRALTIEDQECSDRVGRPILPLPQDTILIPKEIDELRFHIKEMKELRRRRIAQLEEMQIELSDLCETLDVEPLDAVERKMLMESADNCVLSDANMQAVVDFLSRLQGHLKANNGRREEMVNRITSLCERLGYNAEKANQFMPIDDKVTDAALSLIESNLNQLEELKRQHMSQFISASKRELEAVWTKCYTSDVIKASFLPYHSDQVDEETLDALEAELTRMKGYHERNLALFDKVDEWHQTWFLRLEMEARAKDKTRLLGRGRNNLLEEEKERKAVLKKLPRVEKELTAFVEAFNEANPSKQFELMGMGLVDYIRDQKAEHKAEVKDERETKKDIKKKMLQHETMYGATPLTPINQTSAALMKSRRDLASSSAQQKSMSTKRPGVDNLQATASAKRRKMYDNSILCGNLPQHSVNSVESTTLYRDRDIVSSTFNSESRQPGGRLLRTPRGTRVNKTSTPSKTATTSLFKTPASAASKSRLLRSGAKTTGASASTTSLHRAGRDVRKIPFKL